VKSARPVVLDACVLVPMPLADTLLRLAAGPRLFLPKWSDQIMVEVTRTLRETFGLSDRKAMHRESEIRQHFPEAWIEDYEDLIPAMTNHPKDRHVLAAAAHAGVKVIVTYNIKEFPALLADAIFDNGTRTICVSQGSLWCSAGDGDADVGGSSRHYRPVITIFALPAPN
jgi:predicted nucleic acid-binding protein